MSTVVLIAALTPVPVEVSEVENSISSVIFEQPLTESHIVKAMTMHEIINELTGEENE